MERRPQYWKSAVLAVLLLGGAWVAGVASGRIVNGQPSGTRYAIVSARSVYGPADTIRLAVRGVSSRSRRDGTERNYRLSFDTGCTDWWHAAAEDRRLRVSGLFVGGVLNISPGGRGQLSPGPHRVCLYHSSTRVASTTFTLVS